MKKAWLRYLAALLTAAGFYIMNGSYQLLLLVCMLLLFLILGALACILGGRKLHLTFDCAGQIEEADGVDGSIWIKNKSFFPVLRGKLTLKWENQLIGIQGNQKLSFAVLPYGSVQLPLPQQIGGCGTYQLEAGQVQISDLFQLFCSRRQNVVQTEILVYPQLSPIRLPIHLKDSYDMESFRYADAQSGDDVTETFDIRAYRSGDSIRKIHWKLTGKLEQIMIRESSYPVFHSLLLLLETGYQKDKKFLPEQMEAAVAVFWSAAQMLIDQGRTFGIGFLDYKTKNFNIWQIETREELWIRMPELLHSASGESDYSVYEQYQFWYGDQRYAQYLYVTAGASYPECTEYAELTIVRCSDTYSQGEQELDFTAANWKEELA